MFDCHLVEKYSQKKSPKEGPNLVYWFQQSMESGDASDKEAPPSDPKSNNLMPKEQLKAISMLVDMETEDGLERGDIMVIANKLAWHMQTYSAII